MDWPIAIGEKEVAAGDVPRELLEKSTRLLMGDELSDDWSVMVGDNIIEVSIGSAYPQDDKSSSMLAMFSRSSFERTGLGSLLTTLNGTEPKILVACEVLVGMLAAFAALNLLLLVVLGVA